MRSVGPRSASVRGRFSGCPSGPDVRLKSLRAVNNNSGTMPGPAPVPGADPDGMYVLQPEHPQDYTTIDPDRAPHYWQSDGFRTVAAAAVSLDVSPAGSERPWAIELIDNYDSEMLWVQFSCEAVAGSLFAPDIPVLTPGYRDMEAGRLTPGGDGIQPRALVR